VLTPCRVSWGCRYDPLCADEWRQPCAEALAEGRLRYVYWDSGALVAVAGSGIFPIASDAICDRMPLVGACALAPTSLHAPRSAVSSLSPCGAPPLRRLRYGCG
jgi:hypothetical protein